MRVTHNPAYPSDAPLVAMNGFGVPIRGPAANELLIKKNLIEQLFEGLKLVTD